MWIVRKVDEAKITTYVSKGFITQQEANMILATPQQ
jgi:hypothetical protein